MEALENQLQMHKTHWDIIEGMDPALYKKIAQHTTTLQEQDWQGMFSMEEETYHHGPGISQSMLKDMAKNANFMHFRNIRNFEKKETRAMTFGDMLHKSILEPHLLREKYFSDATIMEQLAGEYKKPRSTKAYKEYETDVKSEGRTLVPYEDWETMNIMVEKVWSHPTAKNLLKGGMAEQSIYAKDPETGLLCRIRTDWTLMDGVLIDLKTTADASEEEFSRSIYKYGIHVQGAYYNAVSQWAFGGKFTNFLIIAFEKQPPYDLVVYRVDEGALDLGETFYRKYLNELAECINKGKFPSYPASINPITVPHWAFQKEV